MSIIGTFSVMYLLDYSLDNLSLMALTLAVGFVVDDAIVMLENIVRHMEMGKPPMQAAIDGAAEVGFTILSMTISLAAVFIPIPVPGRHRRPAVPRVRGRRSASAILVSGFVSLTLTPMLSSRFLRARARQEARPVLQRDRARATTGCSASTSGRSRGRCAHRALDAGVLGRSSSSRPACCSSVMPKGFIPDARTPASSTSRPRRRRARRSTTWCGTSSRSPAIVQKDTERSRGDVVASAAAAPPAEHRASCTIDLKPLDERSAAPTRSSRELRAKLRERARHHGVSSRTRRRFRSAAAQSKSLYQFTLQSSRHRRRCIRRRRSSIDACAQVAAAAGRDERPADRAIRRSSVDIDRERAAPLGVTATQIENALYDAYGSRQVSTIYTPTNEYWVVMELLPEYQHDLSALEPAVRARRRRARSCRSAPSRRSRRPSGPVTVNHSGQLPSVTLSFNLAPGVSLGDGDRARCSRLATEVLPATVDDELLRHGAGVPVDAGRACSCCSCSRSS